MEEEEGEVLKVRESPISGSGIARINTKTMERNIDLLEGKPALLRSQSAERVVRLVADDMMEEGWISLREKDRKRLKVSRGDEVTLLPLKGVGIITKRLASLKK